jgi:hypothetical protein
VRRDERRAAQEAEDADREQAAEVSRVVHRGSGAAATLPWATREGGTRLRARRHVGRISAHLSCGGGKLLGEGLSDLLRGLGVTQGERLVAGLASGDQVAAIDVAAAGG